jgi:hypothetical protein
MNAGDRNIMQVLDAIFEKDGFQVIEAYDQEILRTSEYANSLPDFQDLTFSPSLSCREVTHVRYDTHFSRTYYADFETIVNVPLGEAHKPYLCCVVSRRDDGKIEKTVIKEDFANSLLDYLEDESLCYFHNLKYDACQFMSDVTDYQPPKMLERNGKIMKLTFTKLGPDNKVCKKVTFMDSYSIISAPLKKFGEMFKLEIHKELCPYNLYTEETIAQRILPYQAFV